MAPAIPLEEIQPEQHKQGFGIEEIRTEFVSFAGQMEKGFLPLAEGAPGDVAKAALWAEEPPQTVGSPLSAPETVSFSGETAFAEPGIQAPAKEARQRPAQPGGAIAPAAPPEEEQVAERNLPVEEVPSSAGAPWQTVKEARRRDFSAFKDYLAERMDLSPQLRDRLARTSHPQIYFVAAELGLREREMAQWIAEFLDLPYISYIDPAETAMGVLPVPFAKSNQVVAANDEHGQRAFILGNPFNLALLDTLKTFVGRGKTLSLILTEPANIVSLFEGGKEGSKIQITKGEAAGEEVKSLPPLSAEGISLLRQEIEKSPLISVADNILRTAVYERASDIHIEPKGNNTTVRFRIDGDMRDMFNLKANTGVMLITRYKVLGGLDIAEKRKPQDGSVEAVIDGKSFKMRLATTSTPEGESLIIRLLEPEARPKKMAELGFTKEQEEALTDFAKRTHGLILIVGPTGSGKTTTIYSFMSHIDTRGRSLITVEDPVEYRIPNANQQQVNEKAGVTFEALLKSSVRQDPDILFIGEVRDPYSARMAMDFASTGHIAISTLHTNNSTTAIFRLERLGISRGTMADAVVGIVAQRLLKKLCPHCREIRPLTAEEARILQPFTSELPAQTAHPKGCPKCNHMGYHGREGIYEIMRFDPEVADLVRTEAPVSEIREFFKSRGGFLISHHAVEKVKKLIFPLKDVYERVLIEEGTMNAGKAAEVQPATPPPEKKSDVVEEELRPEGIPVLLVEDDADTQNLVARILQKEGYQVTVAGDGIDALMRLGEKPFDLILSDVNMPNLDGFKLLELMQQKGIHVPVILLTGRIDPEDEVRGLDLGAADYIKKPIKKEILLHRVRQALPAKRGGA